MNQKLLVSIIINNYNYDRFLAEAIDSALNQTYPHTEVIVVDDGSTDNSREIITSYEDRVISILQDNGGQSSALNAGFTASSGEIILLLDADDTFCPHKVEEIVTLCHKAAQENSRFIISNAFQTIDEKGRTLDIKITNDLCAWLYLDKMIGRDRLIVNELTPVTTSEQVYQFAVKYRFIPYLGSPTSSLVLTRALAEVVFPLPSEQIKTSADDFLVKACSLLGSVYFTNRVLTNYRIHGKNNWFGTQQLIKQEFFTQLDAFLNAKLKSNGKKAVFSYFNSLDSKGYYRQNYGENCSNQLFNLALKVLIWHVNRTTIIFFIKTTFLAAYFRFRKFISA